jgi:hypothetical protein
MARAGFEPKIPVFDWLKTKRYSHSKGTILDTVKYFDVVTVTDAFFTLHFKLMAADWRRLHNEELRNLYASPNVAMVIKSRRIK